MLKYTIEQDSKRNFTALLVEDDDQYRTLMRLLLCDRFPSIAVLEVSDGESALEILVDTLPDLVLLDISLPGIDGLVVNRRIREIDENIIIVILSGYDIEEYRQQAFKDGADCYIYKGAKSSTADVLARVEGTMKRKYCRQ